MEFALGKESAFP